MPSNDFTITRRVQFAETDAAGVLHFANYFRMMEEVEHAFWRSLGHSVWFHDGDGVISWPRVHCTCEYASPAKFEDELSLTFRVARMGKRSVTFEVDFHRDGLRIASGRTKAACCAIRDGAFRSIAIPDNVRCVLRPFVADQASAAP
ncbi:MAG: acyl-CoA thioesterase [Phycisphaerales bacterium]|nr:acyl-CoA thioesterase [Phycisphaerales bacterium]